MAHIGENVAKERTRREVIDAMLLTAGNLAQENNRAMLRLRGTLVGALPEEKQPEQPARPGWLGETADVLETIIAYLDDTAKMLEEVSRQVAPRTPTPMTPGR